jgi:hypothetical protein
LAATSGGVEEAGAQGRQGVIAAGAGSQTPIHALGNGATWITEQGQLPFGTQGQYLVDFYHLGDYLSAAADALAPKDKQAWREDKKTWLMRIVGKTCCAILNQPWNLSTPPMPKLR